MREHVQKRAIRRLGIAIGQMRGLERMVRDDTYCIDIIHQSLAIKQALSGIEDLILENHLSEHVVSQVRSGRAARAVKEILAIYKLSKKK